ncbi:HEAT repeat domain-containing protein [Pedosphaera parvula]|uniref:PBS lyase HEAT domain protein repeat-containing protein n=1 Tax=Pedosphaera parvula (strain Ellin514) TaxID=320771 RepID=B9XEP1_PEDPL|nr:HEAT repeat domain-containing protein [Pedosphaera parvula]EEF61755.1 PBS lyase HEAT domain protein repeat-containing protein [Pedosphaera parvula Ellin514]
MMKKNQFRLMLIIVVLAAILGGLAWHSATPKEPIYHGKPLGDWLEGISENMKPEQEQALLILAKMGTNATPIIVRKLEQNDSPIRNKYRDAWPTLPAWPKKVLPTPAPETFTVEDAERAFRSVLGTNMASQLPQLLTHPNPAVREAVAPEIWEAYRLRSIPSEQLLSLCIFALKDPDPLVRFNSALVLERFGPAASNAVPNLIHSLRSSEAGRRKGSTIHVRAVALRVLGSIGSAAASAVPALTNLLSSSDVEFRIQVAAALWYITQDETIALPVFISDVPKLDKSLMGSEAIHPLRAMGPRAKAAVPMLLNEINRYTNYGDNGSRFSIALEAIDPDAAAKIWVK